MNARMLLLGGALLFIPVAAHAETDACQITSVLVPGGQIAANYDPTDAARTQAEFTFSLTASGCSNSTIPFKIDADPSNPQAVSGKTIRLTSGSAVLEAFIAESSGGSASGGAVNVKLSAPGSGSSDPLYLILSPGQQVPYGKYRARLRAEAVPNSDGKKKDAIAASFDVTVDVQPLIGLAAGSGARLDLGQIVAGGKAAAPVTFNAYANVNYKLRFTTDYQLRLRRRAADAEPNIPYLLLFNGQTLANNGAEVAFQKPGLSGFQTHSLDVQVPALPLRPAGTYRDYITVEISAVVAG